MKRAFALLIRRVIGSQAMGSRTWLAGVMLIVISFVMALGGSLAFESQTSERAYSCAELAGASLDLGRWRGGEPKKFPVAIRNDGERRLIVYLVKRDCCGERIAQSISLESQESREIWVEIEPQENPGPFRRTIRFYTSEPSLPKFDVWLQGVVEEIRPISL